MKKRKNWFALTCFLKERKNYEQQQHLKEKAKMKMKIRFFGSSERDLEKEMILKFKHDLIWKAMRARREGKKKKEIVDTSDAKENRRRRIRCRRRKKEKNNKKIEPLDWKCKQVFDI